MDHSENDRDAGTVERWARRALVFTLLVAVVITTTAATVGTGIEPVDTGVDAAVERLGHAVTAVRTDDTDSDRLRDRQEKANQTAGGHALPGADPNRKDIYVRVYVSEGVEPLSREERADLRSIWSGMPVTNPKGSDGITIHVTQVQLSRRVQSDLSVGSTNRLRTEIYEQRLPESAACSVHAVVLADVTTERSISGQGSTPGYFAVVDGSQTETFRTNYSIRTVVITHELLHNVVGRFDDGAYHTSDGWLRGSVTEHGMEFHTSDRTATRLSEEGFAQPGYFEHEVCG